MFPLLRSTCFSLTICQSDCLTVWNHLFNEPGDFSMKKKYRIKFLLTNWIECSKQMHDFWYFEIEIHLNLVRATGNSSMSFLMYFQHHKSFLSRYNLSMTLFKYTWLSLNLSHSNKVDEIIFNFPKTQTKKWEEDQFCLKHLFGKYFKVQKIKYINQFIYALKDIAIATS